MAEPKKLTTAEILALARQKKAGGAAPAETPAEAAAPTPPAEAAEASPAPVESVGDAPAASPPATPAAKPKSTADILAAARAQKAGGAAAKPVAGGAAPKSTADILAAARAQKAAAGGAAPVVAKSAPIAREPLPSEIAALPAGEKPSVEAMIKAVRAGAPVAAVKPKLPAKPVLVAKKGETRRTFLDEAFSAFWLGWAALAAFFGLGSLATARFMMPNTVLELPSRFKVGSTSEYPLGTVSEKYKASRGVWIVHTDSYDGRNQVYALASVCTHLGCTPNWLEAEQKFKCPCHGSGFYINGINFEGPAPRPLERVGLRVSEDGQLEVDKSLKFQEELGQWSDEKSFVVLS